MRGARAPGPAAAVRIAWKILLPEGAESAIIEYRHNGRARARGEPPQQAPEPGAIDRAAWTQASFPACRGPGDEPTGDDLWEEEPGGD